MSGLVSPPIPRFSGIFGTGGGGGGGGTSWLLLGNAGTNAAINFVGTTDAQDLVLSANSIERVRLIVGASIRFSDSAGNSELFIDDYEALTQSNVRIRASGPIADVALVLSSSGNGPTLANSPDGGVSGGNPRGIYATDFQKLRNDKIQVAGGDYSGILAGENNEISPAGMHSCIVGGLDHVLDGDRSVIAGGSTNAIRNSAARGFIGGGAGNVLGSLGTTDSSVIGGGAGNDVYDGDYHTIGGGLTNSITSGWVNSFIGGGVSNILDGSYGTLAGGALNGVGAGVSYASLIGGRSNSVTTDAYYGAALGGYWSVSTHYAEASHAAGIGINGNPNFFAAGGAQHSWVVWRNRIPATGVATELFLDGNEGAIAGSPFRFDLQFNNDMYQFEIQVAAKDTVNAGQAAWWKIIGGIYRDGAGTTALVGAPTLTTQNTGGLAAGWTLAIAANAADDTLRISVTVPFIVGAAPVAVVASGHMTHCRFA